jgi:hypothetical protein
MKRIGVLVVAYNASSTPQRCWNRIPPDVRGRLSDVLVRRPQRRRRHAGRAYRKPAIEQAQDAALALRPTLFAYQFIYELRPVAPPTNGMSSPPSGSNRRPAHGAPDGTSRRRACLRSSGPRPRIPAGGEQGVELGHDGRVP